MIPTPVTVTIKISDTDGEVTATCVEFEGDTPTRCYMTPDQAALFGDDTCQLWTAEWNGVSFDLIEPVFDDAGRVDLDQLDIPF